MIRKSTLLTLGLLVSLEMLAPRASFSDLRAKGLAKSSASTNISKSAMLSIGCVLVAAYFCFRESNSKKVTRALDVWNKVESSLRRVQTLQDVQKFLQKFNNLEQDVFNSYEELSARYMNLAPWNWTLEMKVAYKRMKFLFILFKHKEVICCQKDMTEEELCKLSRVKYGAQTPYALCRYSNLLDDGIKEIFVLSKEFSCSFGKFVKEKLQIAFNVLIHSDHYMYEQRCLSDANQKTVATACDDAFKFKYHR